MLTKVVTVISFVIFVSIFSWQVWIASMQPHDHNATNNREQNAAKEIKPQSSDERLALYTEWLAAFTGLLAVVSGIQGIFLFRADRTARIAAEAARDTAIKIGLTADLAEKQMLLAGRQADIQERQHGLTRLQYIATHRPLLRVRYFRRIDISDQKIRINFTIINVGSSQANLLGSCGRLGFFAPGNLPPPFYEGAPWVLEPRKFEPGATDEGIIIGTPTRRQLALCTYTDTSFTRISLTTQGQLLSAAGTMLLLIASIWSMIPIMNTKTKAPNDRARTART